MSTDNWLQLTEYSNKYDVSISTLRRRIKEDSIEFRLASGKYFLLDEPPTLKPRGRKPGDDRGRDFFSEGSQIGSAIYFDSEDVSPVGSASGKKLQKPTQSSETKAATNAGHLSHFGAATNGAEPPIFSVANKLLEELKKAYSQILQEKEEQILQFKEEIADLRTLAQVLESENERLRKKLNS